MGGARGRLVAVEWAAIVGDDGLVLRLIDDAGRVGWGEAVVRAGFGDPSARTLAAAAAGLGAGLGGRDLGPHGSLAPIVEIAAGLADLPSPLRFAAETALLDLAGQADGVAIAALLGGPAAAPSVPRSAFLKGHVSWDMLQETGFRAAKIKAAGPWPAGLAALLGCADEAARRGLALRVDCNGSMPVGAAPALLRALAERGVDYVEEPCAGLGAAAWRALAGAGGPSLAVDESALSEEAFAAHLEAGAAAVMILKPCFVGGLLAARERALRARARGLRVVITSALEGAIGAAAAAHLALALGIDEACGITLRAGAEAPAWLDPGLATIRAPDRPGLGVGGPA